MYSEVSLLSVVSRQYRYKLKGFSFNSLIAIQAVILLVSLGGTLSYGAGANYFSFSLKAYSSDMVIICTMLWVFVMAALITKPAYKNIEFTLVSSRLSSWLSDVGLIATFCVLGAVTATLSGYLLRVILYFFADHSVILESAFRLSAESLLFGAAGGIFYMLLIGSIGYLFGMLVEISKIAAALLLVLLYGLARTQTDFFLAVWNFFVRESSLPLFAGKTVVFTALCLLAGLLLFHGTEVKKS